MHFLKTFLVPFCFEMSLAMYFWLAWNSLIDLEFKVMFLPYTMGHRHVPLPLAYFVSVSFESFQLHIFNSLLLSGDFIYLLEIVLYSK